MNTGSKEELVSSQQGLSSPVVSLWHPFLISDMSKLTSSSMLEGFNQCPYNIPNTKLRGYNFDIFLTSLYLGLHISIIISFLEASHWGYILRYNHISFPFFINYISSLSSLSMAWLSLLSFKNGNMPFRMDHSQKPHVSYYHPV